MKIEEAIFQKEFKHKCEKLVVNLLHTHSHMVKLHNDVLKPYKLTLPQYNALRILRGQHPGSTSITDVNKRMVDKASNGSRIIDKLVAKKLVSRRVSGKDRRRMDVRILQKGLDLLALLDDKMELFYENFSHMSESEAQNLSDLLDKFRTKQ